MELLRSGIRIHLLVLIVVSLPVVIFAPAIIRLFAGGDAELIVTGARAIRLFTCLTSLGMTAYFISCYYQSVEKVRISIIIGISRYVVVIPLMFLLSSVFGVMGVWYSQFLSIYWHFAWHWFHSEGGREFKSAAVRAIISERSYEQ